MRRVGRIFNVEVGATCGTLRRSWVEDFYTSLIEGMTNQGRPIWRSKFRPKSRGNIGPVAAEISIVIHNFIYERMDIHLLTNDWRRI